VVAVALHDGQDVQVAVAALLRSHHRDRWREEDPFTATRQQLGILKLSVGDRALSLT